MARRCIVCDKGTVFGNTRSHAMNKTRRTWKPNLQRVRVRIKGFHNVLMSVLDASRAIKSSESSNPLPL